MIINDVPVQKTTEDLLGRKNLAHLISKHIIDYSKVEHPCLCVGIYGKWGEGKTSLLNFVEEDICSIENVQIVHFNPWMICGQEALVKEFFSCFSSKVEDTIKQSIKKYSKAISFTSKYIVNYVAPGLGDVVSSAIDKTAETITTFDKSLIDQKDEISSSIVNSGKHIVVIIDDIDRLDKEETHALLRLIRQVADFGNTYYLLAMDPIVVSKSICSYYGNNNIDDGTHFLEKIIQIPIQLPVIQSSHLCAILTKELNGVLQNDKFRLHNTIESISEKVSSLFSNIRQIYRFINQLHFVLPSIREEVNIEDLCLLEAIKTISVPAYLNIHANRNALLKEHDIFNEYIDKNAEKKRIEECYALAKKSCVEGLPFPVKEAVLDLIDTLFAKRINQNTFIQTLLDNKNICTPLYFNMYFIQDVPEGVISQKDINAVYSGFHSLDDTQLSNWINKFRKEYNDGEMKRAIVSILRLEKNYKKRVLMSFRFIQLLSVSDLANQFENSTIVWGNDLCSFVNAVLLKDYMVSEFSKDHEPIYAYDIIDKSLMFICENAKIGFAMAINAVFSKYNHIGYINEAKPDYIKLLVEKFLQLPYSEQIRFSKFVLIQFFFVWKIIDENAPKQYLQELLQNQDFDAVSFVEHLIEKDSSDYPQDLQNFIVIFKESVIELYEYYKKNTDNVSCFAMQALSSNYATIMENNK